MYMYILYIKTQTNNQGYIEAHKIKVNRANLWVLKYSLFNSKQ